MSEQAPKTTATRDHGCLPDWRTAELPEPLPLSPRNILTTIGPGAILLRGFNWWRGMDCWPDDRCEIRDRHLWIATLGIILQWLFNLEAIRYTLYTGEPVLTGIMRLNPGPKVWGCALYRDGDYATGHTRPRPRCASVLFASFTGDLPDKDGGDRSAVMWISYGVLVCTVLLLMSGKSIEKLLEKLSWAMVIFIFAFLLFANFQFVPWEVWKRTAIGSLSLAV